MMSSALSCEFKIFSNLIKIILTTETSLKNRNLIQLPRKSYLCNLYQVFMFLA